ncbi:hypothetical protein FG91_04033 [Sphingopyxis sp. LC81]|uniref:hypothetical protein n=1 Tax=Sphingopyxis sp. LC81 TaxID=1502850 RepID=UPI00050E8EC0|nr:hypothetical protein [Sphingopyxis sp. LC81]KGB51671.1 hypothetical protein FG91_04033 [Sphingopyxis sp. LC81]
MNSVLLVMLSAAMANSAVAQSPATAEKPRGTATLDWNAKPRAFSTSDYEQLLSCTLSRHPKETRGYAEYHLHWRDIQTPEQNERDPNSQLLTPALDGCLQMADGEPFPFSLDRLIADWGKAHSMIVVDAASLASCAARNNNLAATGYVAVAKDPTMKAKSLNMMQTALTMPPCSPVKPFSVKQNELLSLLTKELATVNERDN